ncbi:hypothetical protein D7Y37_13765 [Stenotrophomonas maltophilia]|nr:hypothetical protein [Stenotrophomonas maltophilia]
MNNREVICTEPLVAAAALAVAIRLREAADLGSALAEEGLWANSSDRALVDAWLKHNDFHVRLPLPVFMGKDLRALQQPLQMGLGWTVMPAYLCRGALASGQLSEIVGPVGRASLEYFLVWTASGLRQPRVAHATQTLLWQLGAQTQQPG